ncbi:MULTISPECIES: permease-like cell division protein FtsX [Thermocrispum]|jgi:cell division transport system permease protein|uniref:Cell division protein FtsX n=1 Tax=Thermocrispum agreste TaxID=37925 RepID=A0A2W4J856_9PSEU|nr:MULTISPECIES: permease-like cell division protein FtsX [Thermocrispum]PZM94368.1 MAG: ABC transporter permease [Thermocrispum agreste]
MRAQFVFSEVVTGLRRNVTMTIAMILTTAISLMMFGAGLLFTETVNRTEQNFIDDLEVRIFLNKDISRNAEQCTTNPQCAALQQALQNHPAVDDVVFTSQKEAVEKARELFAEDPEMLELLSPTALPASLDVRLVDPQRSAAIVQEFANQPGVDKIHDGGEDVDRLVEGLNLFRNGAFVISVVLLIAALLLIANMIQVSAFTRRTEVSIMRLVGATRWYTQLPFLLEAMFAGLIGAVIAIAGLLIIPPLFVPDAFEEQIQGLLRFPDALYTAVVVGPILMITSMVISALVGYVTLRLYVRH